MYTFQKICKMKHANQTDGLDMLTPKNDTIKKMCVENDFKMQIFWKHNFWRHNVNVKRAGRIVWWLCCKSYASLVTHRLPTSGQSTGKGGNVWLTMNCLCNQKKLCSYGKITSLYHKELCHTVTWKDGKFICTASFKTKCVTCGCWCPQED